MNKAERIIEKILESTVVELISQKGFSHCTERALATIKEVSKQIIRDVILKLKIFEKQLINFKDNESSTISKINLIKEIYFPTGYKEISYKDFIYKQIKLNEQFKNKKSFSFLEQLNILPSNLNLQQSLEYKYKEKSGTLKYEKAVFKDSEIDIFIANIEKRGIEKEENQTWEYKKMKKGSIICENEPILEPLFSDTKLSSLLKRTDQINCKNNENIVDLLCEGDE